MRKTIGAAMAILLCTAGLAACGDSGSTATTTKTATVPTGKLGSFTTRCDRAYVPVAKVNDLYVKGVSCSLAEYVASKVILDSAYDGFTCDVNRFGTRGSAVCKSTSDPNQSFGVDWRDARPAP